MSENTLPELSQTTVLERLLPVLRQGLTDSLGVRLDRVILFGSRARGDAGPAADVDVLVVVKDEPDCGDLIRRTSQLIGELSLGFDVVISRAFVSRERFENEHSPFLINIRREGVPV
jgi:predicted nucleotidyltransferase